MKLRHISYIIGTLCIIGIPIMLTIQITSMETEPNDPEGWKREIFKTTEEVIFGGPNEPTYYHPFDPRAYTCPKCYKGAKGKLCPGHCEPNEPNEVWVTDPNLMITTFDPNLVMTTDDLTIETFDFTTDTLSMADTDIYLKNMPLLTKDEIRDFAIVIGAAAARLYACDEFYEGLLRLVPEKLLQDPEKPEPNEPSTLEIKCSCGIEYEITGRDICYRSRFIMFTDTVTDPNEPRVAE